MLKGSCKKLFAGMMIVSLIGSIFPIIPIVQAENLPSYYERTLSEREKAFVVWGYHSGNSKVFRMNMGWGNGFHAGYRTSDVDMNLDSVVYSSATHPVIGYVTISIDGR